jgi:hypothetical protein
MRGSPRYHVKGKSEIPVSPKMSPQFRPVFVGLLLAIASVATYENNALSLIPESSQDVVLSLLHEAVSIAQNLGDDERKVRILQEVLAQTKELHGERVVALLENTISHLRQHSDIEGQALCLLAVKMAPFEPERALELSEELVSERRFVRYDLFRDMALEAGYYGHDLESALLIADRVGEPDYYSRKGRHDIYVAVAVRWLAVGRQEDRARSVLQDAGTKISGCPPHGFEELEPDLRDFFISIVADSHGPERAPCIEGLAMGFKDRDPLRALQLLKLVDFPREGIGAFVNITRTASYNREKTPEIFWQRALSYLDLIPSGEWRDSATRDLSIGMVLRAPEKAIALAQMLPPTRPRQDDRSIHYRMQDETLARLCDDLKDVTLIARVTEMIQSEPYKSRCQLREVRQVVDTDISRAVVVTERIADAAARAAASQALILQFAGSDPREALRTLEGLVEDPGGRFLAEVTSKMSKTDPALALGFVLAREKSVFNVLGSPGHPERLLGFVLGRVAESNLEQAHAVLEQVAPLWDYDQVRNEFISYLLHYRPELALEEIERLLPAGRLKAEALINYIDVSRHRRGGDPEGAISRALAEISALPPGRDSQRLLSFVVRRLGPSEARANEILERITDPVVRAETLVVVAPQLATKEPAKSFSYLKEAVRLCNNLSSVDQSHCRSSLIGPYIFRAIGYLPISMQFELMRMANRGSLRDSLFADLFKRLVKENDLDGALALLKEQDNLPFKAFLLIGAAEAILKSQDGKPRFPAG